MRIITSDFKNPIIINVHKNIEIKTEFNSFVAVELKIREIKPQDKGQIESYMKAIDKEIELIKSSNIYALEYQLLSY